MSINKYGFVRVAACSPNVRVADCDFNVSQIKLMIDEAVNKEVQLLVFPELSITSTSCGDLFYQDVLQHKAMESLDSLVRHMKNIPSLMIAVGLPLRIDSLLFNVAALISSDGILGFVPKSNTYADKGNNGGWFSSCSELPTSVLVFDDKPITIGNLIVRTPFANIAVEIGSDILQPIQVSSHMAMHGADIVCSLSADAAQMGMNSKLKSLIKSHSERLALGYIYSSAGVGESSTDYVYAGNCVIAENGELLSISDSFSLNNEMVISDIDISALRGERLRSGLFKANNVDTKDAFNIIQIDCNLKDIKDESLQRKVSSTPFIPSDNNSDELFQEIYNIQAHALAKRILHTNSQKVVLGVSGGLDSTLALLVTIKAFDLLKIPRENIYGITMPGFGTTGRTYNNAINLMDSLGITNIEISIKDAVVQHFKDIDHDINKHDLTYENSQARERTQILMDYAGKIGGFVVGTGNMSELALGWATYNGDHMSMYAVNASVPKTLVQAITRWIAMNEYSGLSEQILQDIVNTPYSPELLPADISGDIAQKTEHFIGPYELHDFFLFRMLRFGDDPQRIAYIAKQAFLDKYSDIEIKDWLKVFYRRFFSQQFKRSCMPDGPTVVSVSLSPRGGLVMPSDAVGKAWINQLD